jgi:RHS repeat-associated protein
MTLYNMNVATNGAYGFPFLVPEMTIFYPNGFISINSGDYYTKHYYAEDQRIASKIGNGSILPDNLCDDLENRFNISQGELDYLRYLAEDKIQQDLAHAAIPEQWVNIVYDDHAHSSFNSICELNGDRSYEDELYFYHGNHLSSTQMVTDMYGNVAQQVHYAPFGEVITEYYGNQSAYFEYKFNGKEYDYETGMYYYSARYYAPPVFISRDPLFEEYFWMSPYAYCANNPVKYVDPTGMEFDPAEDKKYVQPMERDIQAKMDGLKKQMAGLTEGSDEYNRLNDHVTELGNALTEISALRADKDNFYKINFGDARFSKDAGGGYADAAGSLTYDGVNGKGQNIIGINMSGKYAGTTGTMLHEFKHADQYRTGDLGFYVNGAGQQVSAGNSQELERAANYRGDVYSFGRTTPAYNNYKLQGYESIPTRTRDFKYHQNRAAGNGLHYITGGR